MYTIIITMLITSLFWIVLLYFWDSNPGGDKTSSPTVNKPQRPTWPKEDRDRTLRHVFELTWQYFSEHPSTQEYTEIQVGEAGVQIISEGSAECHEYEVLVVSPKYDDLFRKSFKGTTAEIDAETFVLSELNRSYEDRVEFQITALGGPDIFFLPEDFS